MLILTHYFNDNLRLKYPQKKTKKNPSPPNKNPEYGPEYDACKITTDAQQGL